MISYKLCEPNTTVLSALPGAIATGVYKGVMIAARAKIFTGMKFYVIYAAVSDCRLYISKSFRTAKL